MTKADAAPKAGPKPRASAETIAEARRLIETTSLTQADIAQRVGVSRQALCRMVAREGWGRPAVDRLETVRRLRLRVDERLAAIEPLLAKSGGSGLDEAERAAKTLGALVRTLKDLAALDRDETRAGGREDENGGPVDVDALRDELARRLARMRAEDEGQILRLAEP